MFEGASDERLVERLFVRVLIDFILSRLLDTPVLTGKFLSMFRCRQGSGGGVGPKAGRVDGGSLRSRVS